MWLGIDYGSKLAGTTVVCYTSSDGSLHFRQSEKKKDADQFLNDIFKELQPKKVFFDAPLSLPAAYFDHSKDYFYRACDRELKAMSPMFLGGLTARAMKLAANHSKVSFIETYPGYLIRTVLDLAPDYQKKKSYNDSIAQVLTHKYGLTLSQPIDNWHQLDALACWVSGQREANGSSLSFGAKDEGIICV